MNTAARVSTTLAVAFCFAALPALAQDKGQPKERAPVTKVLLENEKMRVTHTTFKPGDVSRTDRKPRATYILKGSMIERTTKDGKKTTYERKAGTSHWLEADSDTVKNIGKGDFALVTFTPK